MKLKKIVNNKSTKLMKRSLLLLTLVLSILFVRADEGMWIPSLIAKYNIADMQSKGFKLTAEDIYSINQPSIKDAIVHFGRGCTGELISPDGLIITNHHCGYGVIQSHSTVENDYLSDGFWAMSRNEELPNPNLTVTFLKSIEDVTEKVLKGYNDSMDEATRSQIVADNSSAIIDSVTNGTHYTARVAPMFYGNQYFLFVFEKYLDVRLVGAPPSDIGKFGGDTDNWMWPRHTGDFSLFRIYADKDNKPAAYSPDNVPYKPKHFLPISLKGIQPNDFTMVYGYPGTTQQYITSQAVKNIVDEVNPLRISLRETRLDIFDSYMVTNDTVRIKYASKHAGVANGWKKWIGERNGLIRLKTVEEKQTLEQQFAEWVSQSPDRKEKYGHIIPRFAELYAQYSALNNASILGWEAFRSVEMLRFAGYFSSFVSEFNTGGEPDLAKASERATSLIERTRSFYKDYYLPIDRDVFVQMLKVFTSAAPQELQPNLLRDKVSGFNEKDWYNFAEEMLNGSVFSDSTKLIYYLTNADTKAAQVFKNDAVFMLSSQYDSIFSANVYSPLREINSELDLLYRSYLGGLMEMQTDRKFYPDANSTLRVAYGHVAGYLPRDGVEYSHFTTLDGIIEKGKMGVYDYVVPEKLTELYNSKNYGRWEVNGTVPVAFVATNHTSGGNSGSPVLNAEGQLIGVNFDRVWEGTMSDIKFDPKVCRNISLDIRYALFVIDKFAGASHLIDEMTIIE